MPNWNLRGVLSPSALSGSAGVAGNLQYPNPLTTATLSGPTAGTSGATLTYTVTLNLPANQTFTVTPTCPGATVTPGTFTITAGSQSSNFTVRAPSNGIWSVDFTISPTLTLANRPISLTTTGAVSTLTLSGPTSGTTGSAATFTVTPNGTVAAAVVTVTPAASNGGVVSPATLFWAIGESAAKTFTITRSTDGSSSVSITNNAGLANTGTPINFTSSTTIGLLSATINAAGTQLTLVHSTAIDVGVNTNDQPFLSMTPPAAAATLTYVSGIQTATWVWAISRTIFAGEAGNVFYNQSGDGYYAFGTLPHVPLPSYNVPFTNNSTAQPPAATLTSSTINSAGTQISLAFSTNVHIGAGGFSSANAALALSGGACTLTGLVSGDQTGTLVFSLNRTVNGGETGTLGYTQPGNGIENYPSGTDIATFSNATVTNNSVAGPPVLVSAIISAPSTSLILVFSKAVTWGANGSGNWAATLSGGAVIITTPPTGNQTNTLTYTLSRSVAANETGTLAYTQLGDGIKAYPTNELLASIGSYTIAIGGGFVDDTPATANRYHVRAGNGGNGSSWAAAASTLPAALVRDTTYWIGSGSYPGYTVDDAKTGGTTPIVIRKATAALNGADPGWSAAYDTGPAIFASFRLQSTNYVFVNGSRGGGPGSWKTNHGFRFNADANDQNCLFISGSSDCKIRHFEAAGNQSGGNTAGNGIRTDSPYNQHIVCSHWWSHDNGSCAVFPGSIQSNHVSSDVGLILEYFDTGTFDFAGAHAEVSSMWDGTDGNIHWRYGNITAIESTGGLMWQNDAGHTGGHILECRVYGVVWYDDTGLWANGANGLVGGWTGSNGEDCYNLWVYNCTFFQCTGNSTLSTNPSRFGNNKAYNNLWVSCSAGADFAIFTDHNYNHFINTDGTSNTHGEANGTAAAASNPCADPTNLDFRLTSAAFNAMTSGLALPAPFDKDANGNSLNIGGKWVRGAYGT